MCDECAPCDLDVSDDGDVSFDQTYDLNSSGDPISSATTIGFNWVNEFGCNRYQVYLDGVLKYDSSCTCDEEGTFSFEAPAGSEQVRVVVTADCDAGGGTILWFFDLFCVV